MSDGKCDRAFVYKCRLCGELEASAFIYADKYKAMRIIANLNFEGVHIDTTHLGTRVNLTSIHFCEDGGVGISDFQGIKAKDLE